ncbi:hypothetical protein A6R68_04815 [Neotoma lepida]|uniref:Mandelate racemase/muconate lactonizing enzyme C-terminal domain-containing protein n=1 Tax=Neotoma lepida TaxID=56216 RepID=A0A1A6GK53_NEOLE|nr:hypothetical protein A6R68_04815 [Neotoma lepida]
MARGRISQLLVHDVRFPTSLSGHGSDAMIGPEKGVVHLATAAILNAVWDLWAKQEGKDPQMLLSCIDFRYITDVLTEEDAYALCSGTERRLDQMMDANQRWDVPEAVEWMSKLAEFKPLWIEEPTSPDDILGHAAISKALAPLGIGVATGEQCHNRVIFKQLLQANALQFLQIDSCRLGSVNENLSVLLMAKKFGTPPKPLFAPIFKQLQRGTRDKGKEEEQKSGPHGKAWTSPDRFPLLRPSGTHDQLKLVAEEVD